MFKEKLQKLIEKNLKGNSKKTIENLVVLLVLLVITIISINIIWKKDDSKQEQNSNFAVLAQNSNNSNINETAAYNLEDQLESTLSKISGVGKVQVLITYSETSEIVAMQNQTKSSSTTEETDSNRRNKKNRIFR